MRLDYMMISTPDGSFAVVIVPKSVLGNHAVAERTIMFLEQRHFHMPTALMARDDYGVPSSYYGPGELALHLSRVSLEAVPWQQVTLN